MNIEPELPATHVSANEQVKLLDNQVSGKSAKFIDSDGKIIFKKVSHNELCFYEELNSIPVYDYRYRLKNFLPKYIGCKSINTLGVGANMEDLSKRGQWISHMADRNKKESCEEVQYIGLANLAYGYKSSSLMDIKLGQKKEKKASNTKFELSTTNTHNFRINGMSNLFTETDENFFISKYYFQKTSKDEIESHLAFFFFDGISLDISLISMCVNEIKQMILALECFKGGCFSSASLFICYDAYDHSKFSVKLIDFDKYSQVHSFEEKSDSNIIIGLKYIVWYLNSIISRPNFHEQVIHGKELKFFTTVEVVPEHKLNQFVSLSNIDDSPLRVPVVEMVIHSNQEEVSSV